MTVEDITNELENLTYDELVGLNNTIITMARIRRNMKSVTKVGLFMVGDRVTYTGKKGSECGTITKVNRVRCIVDLDNRGEFSIPMSGLEKVN
tara:strand:- start:918 stop:1196 length:279 start_codon:yes stop_codon:yes gene_type:complete